jgi:CBS domain containing-hemolysin-like protein
VIAWLPALIAAALAAATYLAALSLALFTFSRASLESRLDAAGRAADAAWLGDHLDSSILAVTLLRSFARVLLTALVVAWVVGLGDGTRLTWLNLLTSVLIAGTLIWIFTSVFANAWTKHATNGLIISALPLLRTMSIVMRPVSGTLGLIDGAFRRLTGAGRPAEQAGAELLHHIEDTQREGALDEASAEILENVVEFTGTEVSQIMTPRPDIEAMEHSNVLGEVRAFVATCAHSRIPVFRGSLDHLTGVLYVQDLVPILAREPAEFKLQPLLRQPLVVPESKPVRQMLAEFKRSKVHVAIVIDEYGGTKGLVTIEDVLEEIVGEIPDEREPRPSGSEPPELVTIDEARVEVDGRHRIDELNEQLGLHLPEDEDYDTIGGFVLSRLGRVPEANESFEAHEARFTAIAVTPTHVQRVRIERQRDLAPVAPRVAAP